MECTSILIVEDESVVAMDLERKLERLGYHVPAVASSGEEAVRVAAQTCPDLVLMDVRLNGIMDGIEAAGQIRIRFDIPVVYLTAFADDETLERAATTAPFGYLLKPFQERELRATIEMALHKHKMEVALQEGRMHLRLYAKRLKTLREIDQAILMAQSPEAIALAALHHIRECVPCRGAIIALFDFEATEVVLVTTTGGYGADRDGGTRVSLDLFGADDIYANDVRELDIVTKPRSPVGQALMAHGAHVYLRVPLVAQGESIGSLNLGMAKPGMLGDEHVEILCEVADSVRRAIGRAHLSKDAREQEIEVGPLDMASIVAAARQMLQAMIEEQQVEFVLPDTWPVVRGCSPWVEEVWVNCIGNALKCCGDPPRVELGAATEPGGLVRFWARAGDEIAPEERACAPNRSTKPDPVDARVRGLDLSLVQRIVNKLGGQVSVQSSPGKGSTFCFTLPAADCPA